MARFEDLTRRDTRANQPAASAVAAGTLYFVTDEGITERSNGAAWEAYSGAAAAGGGLVLLASITAAASASLDVTTRNAAGQSGAIFQADYDEYAIELVNLVPATNNVDAFLRLSTDGGASYDAASVYANSIFVSNTAGSALTGAAPAAPASSFTLRNTAEINNLANYGLCGSLRLFNPLAALYTRLQGQLSAGAGTAPVLLQQIAFAGAYLSTTAVNAIRFAFTSGNAASGSLRIYGIAKT